ncbi:nucleotide sugar dehydrogenase [Legionella shakespearei]|uniref:UDP-glucose/GDP-mannose dehydrogenase n=1 Tax=Legionella shakespearei DSM 23087 TaxID=1122169 RepID=A0A0W0YV03_9GAMM|nr:nucleotide sugar dehydrogenase [Legionella shakespearei]KTD60717.1 UDP-glucose/GDP-mannose dehydrogenase [Legionella shakespearei DSM 23087]
MTHQRTVSIIGLGYVGLPVAVAFGKQKEVIAFDISEERIWQLKDGIDTTEEVSSDELRESDLFLTSNVEDLKKADFHIVAVPTPIDDSNQPDLSPLVSVSTMIGGIIKRGDIVVYESTVYPGVTEEVCLPIIEQHSGLKGGVDFFVGYSPERINPGDKLHSFTKIKKVVSGQTPEIRKIVSAVYSSVVEAGVYEASSIKVAEAAKVIENTQRDINIAFVNELSIIFHKMGIQIHEVLEAAKTKWNFLPFEPGLVGGHCIGVDPYYLTHKAQQLGFHPEVILSGRRTNDNMGKYIAERVIKTMIQKDLPIRGSKVGILGFTFKENCPDVRNTKVFDIINELKTYHIESVVYDPVADHKLALHEYGVELASCDAVKNLDIVIMAVAHAQFKQIEFQSQFVQAKIILDVKNIFPAQDNVVKL